jgi:hypothetical protein
MSVRAHAQAKAKENCFIQQYIQELRKRSKQEPVHETLPVPARPSQAASSKIKIIKNEGYRSYQADPMLEYLADHYEDSRKRISNRKSRKDDSDDESPFFKKRESISSSKQEEPTMMSLIEVYKEEKQQEIPSTSSYEEKQQMLRELNIRRLKLREELQEIDELERKILLDLPTSPQSPPKSPTSPAKSKTPEPKLSPRPSSPRRENNHTSPDSPRRVSPLRLLSPRMQQFMNESRDFHSDFASDGEPYDEDELIMVNDDSSVSSCELTPQKIGETSEIATLSEIAESYAESPPRPLKPRVYQYKEYKRDLQGTSSPRGTSSSKNTSFDEDKSSRHSSPRGKRNSARHGEKSKAQNIIEWQKELPKRTSKQQHSDSSPESSISSTDTKSSRSLSSSSGSSFDSDEVRRKFERHHAKKYRQRQTLQESPREKNETEKVHVLKPKQTVYAVDQQQIMDKMVDHGFEAAVGKLQSSFSTLSTMITQRNVVESKRVNKKSMYDNMARGYGLRTQKLTSKNHFSRKK